MFRWFERWLVRRRMRKAVRRSDQQEALEACKAVGGDPVRDVWIPMGKLYRKWDDPSDARYCFTQARYVEGLLAVGDACAANVHRRAHLDWEYAWQKNLEDTVESFGEALCIVLRRLLAAGDNCYKSGAVAMGDKAYEAARMDIPPEKLRAFIKCNMEAATSALHSIYASERGKARLIYMNAAETLARRLGEKEWSLRVAMLRLRQGDIDKAVALVKDAGEEIPAKEFRETAVCFLRAGELQMALRARSAIGEAFSHEEILLAAAGLRREGAADDQKKAEILEAYAQGMEKR